MPKVLYRVSEGGLILSISSLLSRVLAHCFCQNLNLPTENKYHNIIMEKNKIDSGNPMLVHCEQPVGY